MSSLSSTADVAREEVLPSTIEAKETARELSMAEVRKALSQIRKKWEEMTSREEAEPVFFSSSLSNLPLTMEEFALRFVQAQHTKRSKAR